MRRYSIMLLIATIALALAAPATAGKPGDRGKPDSDSEPVAGTTCVTPWWDGDVKDINDDGWSDDFTIILDADNPSACVDVLTEFAGVWTVTVEILEGNAPRSLTIVPRDAVGPGDSCGGESRRGDSVTDVWILPHPEDPRGFTTIPVATVNACPGDADPDGDSPEGEYAETVDRDLDSVESVQQSSGDIDDTVIVMEATGEVHPLVLVVFSQGLKKTDRIALHVDLP